jgi:hypothetical protein
MLFRSGTAVWQLLHIILNVAAPAAGLPCASAGIENERTAVNASALMRKASSNRLLPSMLRGRRLGVDGLQRWARLRCIRANPVAEHAPRKNIGA